MSTVVITGANRGIGLEFCRQYKDRGEEVVAVCRKASDELKALGVRVEEGIDVSDPESIRELAKRLEGTAVDILVNNAGIMIKQSLGEIDDEAVEDMVRQYRINSIGPLLVTQALLPNLGKGSKVGIVSSRVGSVADNGSGGSYGYRMSKAAVNMAGKSLAVDLEEKGIAVALLHPGFVRTDMTDKSGYIEADEAAKGLIRRVDELDMQKTGTFWHSNGEELPW
jgi:NAD(P)-dependent dehydrogenase (short-subunit alcohol dehydrogenase family)